jgi:hypothetical protein
MDGAAGRRRRSDCCAAAITLGAVGLHTQLQLDAAQGQIALLQSLYAPLDTVLAAPDTLVTSGVGIRGGTATDAASWKLDTVHCSSTRVRESTCGDHSQVG